MVRQRIRHTFSPVKLTTLVSNCQGTELESPIQDWRLSEMLLKSILSYALAKARKIFGFNTGD